MKRAIDPTVSVIIPIYNGSEFVDRCMTSVCEQTYHTYEIVVVDDGSTDNTLASVYAYQERIPMRILKQAHKGLAAARNAGVQAAKGLYIAFVDVDDWISPNYLQTLVEAAKKHQAETSICRMIKTKAYTTRLRRQRQAVPFVMNGTDALKQMLYQKLYDTSLNGKLIQRKLLCQFPCPENKLFEDFYVVYKLLYASSVVVYSRDAQYYYYQHDKSIMHNSHAEKDAEQWEAAKAIGIFVEREVPALQNAIRAKKFSVACQMLYKLPSSEIKLQEELLAFLVHNRMAVLFDRSARLKNRVAAAVSFFGTAAIQRLYGITFRVFG